MVCDETSGIMPLLPRMRNLSLQQLYPRYVCCRHAWSKDSSYGHAKLPQYMKCRFCRAGLWLIHDGRVFLACAGDGVTRIMTM